MNLQAGAAKRHRAWLARRHDERSGCRHRRSRADRGPTPELRYPAHFASHAYRELGRELVGRHSGELALGFVFDPTDPHLARRTAFQVKHGLLTLGRREVAHTMPL